jgi:hypothetical protein
VKAVYEHQCRKARVHEEIAGNDSISEFSQLVFPHEQIAPAGHFTYTMPGFARVEARS